MFVRFGSVTQRPPHVKVKKKVIILGSRDVRVAVRGAGEAARGRERDGEGDCEGEREREKKEKKDIVRVWDTFHRLAQ